MLRKLPFNIIRGKQTKARAGILGGVAFTLAAKTELTLTPGDFTVTVTPEETFE